MRDGQGPQRGRVADPSANTYIPALQKKATHSATLDEDLFWRKIDMP